MSTHSSGTEYELESAAGCPPARLEGYPTFADFISRDSDAAIYRKYSRLSSRNLLYLQSEVHELEERLQLLDNEDAKNNGCEESQKAARNWSHFSDPKNKKASQHRALQKDISVKVKEYRGCCH